MAENNHSDDQEKPSSDNSLRDRAEAIAQDNKVLTAADIEKLTPAEIMQALHELQVHQIELEVQNEDLKQTQAALNLSRTRYFNLYDLAPVGYLTIDAKGIIEEANLAVTQLVGVPRLSLGKRPFSQFIYPLDQDTYYLCLKRLFATGSPQTCELRLKQSDIEPLWVRINATTETDQQSAKLVIVNIHDRKMAEEALQASHEQLMETLNELQQAQSHLIRQERLAAVGQLSAGMAHDFNNILAVILMQTELALRAVDTTQTNSRLEIIGQQAKHAAALIAQILDFSRQKVAQHKPLDLKPLLEDQVSVLSRIIPENIEIHLSVQPDACFIDGDQSRIRQILINLALNSRDAMPNGGEITICAKRQQYLKQETVPLPEMATGNWIRMTVADTGTGIAEDVMPHIFEPFFTTKEIGKGTGLGLAQVYGIVKQHQGHIVAHTQTKPGAVFEIYFPAMITEVAKQSFANDSLQAGHEEIVLIVEDNLILQEALVSVLDEMNYKTCVAANGAEALKILQIRDDIAVVLSDMIMPVMSGAALFWAMKQNNLNVPVVLLSGYPTEAEQLRSLLDAGLVGFLKKPPDLQMLTELLTLALHAE